MDPIGFEHHDHDQCIATALEAAEEKCAKSGLQFTALRRRVLEILLQSHRAMGAYDVLDVLRAEGRAAQPPVAYRALDFLVSNGFAHRVEKLNAFVACTHPDMEHSPALMICRSCSSVAETPKTKAIDTLDAQAQMAGFVVESSLVELSGLCPQCKDTDHPA